MHVEGPWLETKALWYLEPRLWITEKTVQILIAAKRKTSHVPDTAFHDAYPWNGSLLCGGKDKVESLLSPLLLECSEAVVKPPIL